MQSCELTECQSWLSEVNTRPAANLAAPCIPGFSNQLSGHIQAHDLDLSRPYLTDAPSGPASAIELRMVASCFSKNGASRVYVGRRPAITGHVVWRGFNSVAVVSRVTDDCLGDLA